MGPRTCPVTYVQSDRGRDDLDHCGVGKQLGSGCVGSASMVICDRCRGRLPKRFSDRWVLWHFRPVLYSKRPQRSRKPWKAGVNRVESSQKPLGFTAKSRRGGGAGRAVGLSGFVKSRVRARPVQAFRRASMVALITPGRAATDSWPPILPRAAACTGSQPTFGLPPRRLSTWVLWSIATAVLVFVLLDRAGWAAIHPESIGRWAGLIQRAGLIVGWTWIVGLALRMTRQSWPLDRRGAGVSGGRTSPSIRTAPHR
jgi:hypothetical protein